MYIFFLNTYKSLVAEVILMIKRIIFYKDYKTAIEKLYLLERMVNSLSTSHGYTQV